jgi:putative heme transporter
VVKLAFLAGAFAIGAWAVAGKRDELAGASVYLEDLKAAWVIAALAAEAVAILSFAVLQQRLLRAGRVQLRLPALTAITLAGNAIENSFPGGTAWSAVWAYRQFRHRGASELLSGWTLVAATALSQITLVGLAAVGLLAAGSQGSSLDLVEVIGIVVAITGGLIALWRQRRFVMAVTAGLVRLSQRLFKRPAGDAQQLVDDLLARITLVSPSREDWLVAGGFALGNWVWDCGCLVAAFLAVGAPVPWRALFLAYGAAQLAANLPITPGGLGVVEGSLTIALVAYGGAEASTVAAVLLYRLIAFWALLPVGWAAWALVTATNPKTKTTLQPALAVAE